MAKSREVRPVVSRYSDCWRVPGATYCGSTSNSGVGKADCSKHFVHNIDCLSTPSL
jgi:hypothetical protein